MNLFCFPYLTQAATMRGKYILLILITLAFSGCTEMRIDGDAKVFQSSALGATIRIVIGLGLIGLGIASVVGSLLPDRKPKNRSMKSSEGLSSGQRVGLAVFGGAMGFVGLFLAAISFLFPSKLHVTVYPDRVAMASTYSQTGGREVVVPFADLSTVELRDEPGIVGKMQTFLVFTQKMATLLNRTLGTTKDKRWKLFANRLLIIRSRLHRLTIASQQQRPKVHQKLGDRSANLR